MSKIIAALVTGLAIALAGATPAHADFKFGPKATQCQAQPDQPNCVGSH